jgi:DNA-binding CsgD family transcriptional regulator
VFGRDEELKSLHAFLTLLATGPSAFVIAGEAGVGKTTLWRAGVDAARECGYLVLEARPVEAEAKLAFAGLGDLLDPELEQLLDALPAPQADALRVALLLERPRGLPPDERTVAVAVLKALRTLAASRPVLVAIDDLQWLDAPSAAVLDFAWRRMRDQSAGLLIARRAGEPAPSARGEDEGGGIVVGPLSLGALHRLLRERLDVVFPRPVLRRVHTASGGNPFFALEIARSLRERAVPLGPVEALPIPEKLHELPGVRLARLPARCRKALCAAAALSQPTAAILEAVLGEDSVFVLKPAIEAHVVECENDIVRFTHPLLASAAYSAASTGERLGLHRRLAEVVHEPEERARHLALATEVPDELVAAELEHAAEHARAHGASAAAGELCEEARRLTPPDALIDLGRRTVAAAGYRFDAGDTAEARILLEGILESGADGSRQAEALALLGRLHLYEGDQPRAADVSRQALLVEEADEGVRAEAMNILASTLLFMREDLEDALRLATQAAAMAGRTRNESRHETLLSMKAVLGGVLGRPKLSAPLRAGEKLGASSAGERVLASSTYHRAVLLLWTDEATEAVATLRRLQADAVLHGDEGALPLLVAQVALAEYLTGHWHEASRAAEESYELALLTGQRPQQALSLSARALVHASVGLESEARADAADALAITGERGMAVARITSVWALGLLELSLDRPEDAIRLLTPVRKALLAAGVGEPGTIRFVPAEIEALIAVGHLDKAAALLEWLDERRRVLDRPWLRAVAARCRGLLLAARRDSAAALGSLEQALLELEQLSWPFERGRTLLALGAAQRRAKQKRAARETLAEALAIFEQLGARLWAEKARTEIGSISGRAPSRGALTPTEERVASLVAEGRTNKEVAAVLFVAVGTVEYHLSHIYAKLGIHSRADLVRRLATPIS